MNCLRQILKSLCVASLVVFGATSARADRIDVSVLLDGTFAVSGVACVNPYARWNAERWTFSRGNLSIVTPDGAYHDGWYETDGRNVLVVPIGSVVGSLRDRLALQDNGRRFKLTWEGTIVTGEWRRCQIDLQRVR